MKVKTQNVKKNILKSIKIKNKNENKLEDIKFANNNEDDDDEEESDYDSDRELQLAFARKELKPGLNIEMPAPKTNVNDQDGLTRKLNDIYLKMDWIERLDVTVDKNTLMESLVDASGNKLDLSKEFADDDFKRESFFLKQAELSAKEALANLSKLNVSTKRPDDYFAEMAKSDEHMKRVRENLLSKHAETERREKVRKLRELKKMGKQIQIEVEKKKQENKKQFIDKVNKIKKGQKDDLPIELEEDVLNENGNSKKRKFDSNEEQKSNKKKNTDDKNSIKKKGKKSEYKDKKFGFGGRKKRSKYNTSESYADIFNNGQKKNNKDGKKGGGNKFGNKPNKKFMNKNKPKKNKNF